MNNHGSISKGKPCWPVNEVLECDRQTNKLTLFVVCLHLFAEHQSAYIFHRLRVWQTPKHEKVRICLFATVQYLLSPAC